MQHAPTQNLIHTVTATAGAVHTVTNTWEPTRDVLDIRQNKVGTDIVSEYDYAVNSIGQRTGVATSGTAFPATPTWDWGYDSLGQVTSADSSVSTSDRAYEYDAIGNRKKSADSLTLPATDNYVANALNQYSEISNSQISNPSYDDDGNATAYPLPVAPAASSALTWDAENRMISSTVGTAATAYLYDAQSRRIAVNNGGASTLFVYDGWNCIAEYAGATLSKTRLWGTDLSGSLQGAGGVGGLLSESHISNPQSPIYYPLYDGNGNVSEYLAANGTTAAHFEYDPFGNTVASTDTTNQFAYRFSTKPRDAGTGLYYYGYRYYDPVTGRWPSRDPIGEEGGVNLYAFVGNLPLSRIDLLGNDFDEVVGNSCDGPISGEGVKPTVSIKKGGPLTTKMSWSVSASISGEEKGCCKTCADGSTGSLTWVSGKGEIKGSVTVTPWGDKVKAGEFSIGYWLGARTSFSIKGEGSWSQVKNSCDNTFTKKKCFSLSGEPALDIGGGASVSWGLASWESGIYATLKGSVSAFGCWECDQNDNCKWSGGKWGMSAALSATFPVAGLFNSEITLWQGQDSGDIGD